MARRRKGSSIEAMLDVVSRLPWWGGVALAVVFYLVLHSIAGRQITAVAQPGQMSAIVAQSMWRALAGIGQYLLPMICLIGAGISAWRRRERTALIANVVQGDATSVLDGMSWQQFERLVGEAFRLQGFGVVETGSGADGGVDLVLSKGSEKFLVQCKQWRALKVGVDVVRELYGVMAARGSAGGFVVTSGRFTDDAANFTSGRNISLIDGPKLYRLIQQTGHAARSALPAQSPQPRSIGEASSRAAPTLCPLCAKSMVRRVAKRGANAGAEFWGCTAYPACKGTRPIHS